MNSREKGARGEREFANLLKDHGFKTRRGQQYSGIEGEDVVGLPYCHVEVKRVQNLSIHKAIKQSLRDSEKEVAIVAHRRNHEEWLVTMTFEQWIELYKEWYSGKELEK